MAKFSKTNQHDYMRFKATFADGQVLACTFNRSGISPTMVPFHAELARPVSEMFSRIAEAGKTGAFNYGQLFEVLEPVAAASRSLDEFVPEFASAMRAAYGVDLTAPFVLSPRAATSTTVGKKGRNITVNIAFANGEKFLLEMTARQVATGMSPPHALFMGEVSSLAFQLLLGGSAPAEAAERIRTAAEASADIEGLIEALKPAPTAVPAPPAPRR